MERQIPLRTDSKLSVDVAAIEQLLPSGPGRQVSLESGPDIGKLWQAATEGDWKGAENYLVKHPNADKSIIMEPKMTLLHVAARAGQSEFVLNLIKRLDPEDIAKKDGNGNNALHYIAKVGKVRAAEAMVKKKKELLLSLDANQNTPLLLATEWGVEARKDMVKFLAENTVKFLDESTPKMTFSGSTAVTVVLRITAAGFHDICLLILRNNRELVLEVANVEMVEEPILMVMAKYPNLFKRGSIGFWESFAHTESRSITLHDVKLRLTDSMELVDHICREVSRLSHEEIDSYLDGLAAAVHLAAKNGILELVQIWLNHFPHTLWQVHEQRLLFHVAVEYRQLEIFRYLIDRAGEAKYSIFMVDTELGNILHLAALKAPYPQLHSISGTALQLQREFQWFKMIEELVPGDCKLAARQLDSKTPRELFTMEHDKLHKAGEEWMKSTSENCMVVATLVAGVVFASMIQVPGGVNSDGQPNFLKTIPFAVFSASNGLALFASMTSVLLFLAILTSRYAEEDFAVSLPRTLMGGLFSLFVAIAATIVAFAAALQIAVHSEFKSIYIATAVFGWIPIYFFVRYQFDLLRELTKSTFRHDSFHGQRHRMPWWRRLFG